MGRPALLLPSRGQTLLGDPTAAREMSREMVEACHALLEEHGLALPVSLET